MGGAVNVLTPFRPSAYRTLWRALHRGLLEERIKHLDLRSGLGDHAWVLHGLVRAMKPETCVEIGSARGKSAAYIGLALEQNGRGLLHAIDPHTHTEWNDDASVDTYTSMCRTLAAFGVSHRVRILRQYSREAASQWQAAIDMLFIDGDHSYEGCRADWELFSPHVAPFGVVVFHDTIWEIGTVDERYRRADMGVPRFVDELRSAGYPVLTIPTFCGLSLVQPTPGGVPLRAGAVTGQPRGQ